MAVAGFEGVGFPIALIILALPSRKSVKRNPSFVVESSQLGKENKMYKYPQCGDGGDTSFEEYLKSDEVKAILKRKDDPPIFNAAQAACPGDKGVQKSMLEEVPERVRIDKLPEKQGLLFDEKVKRMSQAVRHWIESESK